MATGSLNLNNSSLNKQTIDTLNRMPVPPMGVDLDSLTPEQRRLHEASAMGNYNLSIPKNPESAAQFIDQYCK